MSPKSVKKSGSKKKKESKKKVEEVKLSELDKEVFQIQIKDLNEKLNRLKVKNHELDVSCQSYKTQVEEVTEDKTEIVTYLRTTLDQRADDILELQERLNGLQKSKEDDRKAHETQVQELKSKYQEMKDQLTSENIVLGGRLASLEEFKAQKEETFARLRALQKQLKQQESEHHQTLRNIEKHNITEKDQLKKEMNQNLQQIASEFRQISNKQMPDTTRRAIQENAVLTNKINKMKHQLESALETNRQMKETTENQKITIKVLEGLEKEWKGTHQNLLKRNELLNDKVASYEITINELQNIKTNCELINGQLAQLKAENLKWKSDAIEKSNLLEVSQNTTTSLNSQLENNKILNKQYKDLLQRVTVSLRSGLNIGHVQESSLKQKPKEEILNDVLDLLNKANIDDRETISRKEEASNINCYFSGDIGLVPRQRALKISQSRAYANKNTQTDEAAYVVVKATTDSSTQRAIKSAAYRLLHQVNCSPNRLSTDPSVNVLMKF